MSNENAEPEKISTETPPPDQVTKEPLPERKKKDPKKVRAGRALAAKNKEAREALKRQQEAEAGEDSEEDGEGGSWLPEMSFANVLSVVGVGIALADLFLRARSQGNTNHVAVSSTYEPSDGEDTCPPTPNSHRPPPPLKLEPPQAFGME